MSSTNAFEAQKSNCLPGSYFVLNLLPEKSEIGT